MKMDKNTLTLLYENTLVELSEPKENVVVSGGSALVFMGIREEARALHLDVPPNVFKWMAIGRNVRNPAGMDASIKLQSGVILYRAKEDTGVSTIDGVYLYSPREMLNQKRWLANLPNRSPKRKEQDLQEIEILKGFMQSNQFVAKPNLGVSPVAVAP